MSDCTAPKCIELSQTPYNGRRTLQRESSGFTLIELIVVILLLSAIVTIVGLRTGSFTHWKEQAFIRKLTETIVFLHHQAVADQAFYQLEFDFDQRSYRVGVLRPEGESEALAQLGSEVGALSIELAAFLSPSLGTTQTLIPPPSFPSLAEPVLFSDDLVVTDMRTMRGDQRAEDGGKAFIMFSPRGFSEFAVIHLALAGGRPLTILVNPFTGNTQIYNEYKEFEWTYGRKQQGGR